MLQRDDDDVELETAPEPEDCWHPTAIGARLDATYTRLAIGNRQLTVHDLTVTEQHRAHN